MGRIVVTDNPVDILDHQLYEHTGPFIDFLVDKFPNGFKDPHTTLKGVNHLAVENYDIAVEKDDTFFIILYPQAPLIPIIVTAVVGAAVSYAIGFVVNSVFGPKGSKPSMPFASATASATNTSNIPSPGSVYSLTIPRNTTRLGQIIPVHYGRNLVVPDIISQPYSYYKDNKQYVIQYMAIGMGTYSINSYRFADTLSTTLGNTVSIHQFSYASHKGEFGHMQNYLGGIYGTDWYENIYTSPEVADQELLPKDTVTTDPTDEGSTTPRLITYYADLYPGTLDEPKTDTYIEGSLFLVDKNIDDAVIKAWRDGKKITLTVLAPNNGNYGSYEVQHFYTTFAERADSALFYKLGAIVGTWDPVFEYYRAIMFTIDETTTGEDNTDIDGPSVGPYAVSPPGTTTTNLSFDITFPSGMYKVSSDGVDLENWTISLVFVAEPIDDDGNVIGSPKNIYYDEGMSTNTPQRRTIQGNVPEARYRVTAIRTSSKSNKAADQSTCFWTGLKAVLGNPLGGSVYGNVHIIAMRIRASEGLASDAHTRFSVDCTRNLNGVPTRNPIDAFYDIFSQQDYGAGRPYSELNNHVLDIFRTDWDGKYFDATFDSSTTVWDALRYSIQIQHATPVIDGGLISIIEDKEQSVPSFAFTEDNIRDINLSYLFDDGASPDGVEGEYKDYTDGTAKYEIYPSTSVDPERIILWGCRDSTIAYDYVRRRWLQLTLRRRIININVELEGHTLVIGTPVHISHSILGPDPILCIINSVESTDEFLTKIETHVYEPGVF